VKSLRRVFLLAVFDAQLSAAVRKWMHHLYRLDCGSSIEIETLEKKRPNGMTAVLTGL